MIETNTSTMPSKGAALKAAAGNDLFVMDNPSNCVSNLRQQSNVGPTYKSSGFRQEVVRMF